MNRVLWGLVCLHCSAVGFPRAAAVSSSRKDTMTVIAGKSTVLPCGGGPVNNNFISWYRQSKDGATTQPEEPEYSIQDDGSLLVRRVKPRDVAQFTCMDNATEEIFANYDLMVRKPTLVRMRTNPSSGALQEGDTFTLSCRVLTDNAAHAVNLLIWRDNQLFGMTDGRVSLTTQRRRNHWRLSIANVTRHDAGRYTCRAKTYFDRAEEQFHLIVTPRVAANCTSDSAELRWSALAPAPAGFRVQMALNGTTVDEAVVPGNMTSVQVSALEPGAHVQFHVQAMEERATPGSASCVVPNNSEQR